MKKEELEEILILKQDFLSSESIAEAKMKFEKMDKAYKKATGKELINMFSEKEKKRIKELFGNEKDSSNDDIENEEDIGRDI